MIPLLDNCKLATDLDFDGFSVKNSGKFLPVPSNAVGTDDPRLIDQRNILNGTVTNASVASTAAIDQSKLDLNGNIPTVWLGNTSIQAAQGNLVQLASLKGANNGYAALDANGRILASNMPSTGPQSGTVGAVSLSLPSKEFNVTTSSLVSGAGTLTAAWQNQPDNSWFGVFGPLGTSPLADVPSFLTKQIPMDIMPDIDASKFTSGIFPVAMLPIVVGMGVGHAKGLLPDPNPAKGEPANASDYLGRDGKWKPMQISVTYQPTLPDVQIILQTYIGTDTASILITCSNKKALIFYLQEPTYSNTPYMETQNPTVLSLAVGTIIHAYSAKAGYNNSGITTYTVPPPPNI